MNDQNQPQQPVKTDTSKPTEVNPGKTGNKTEVDLDKSKTKTYEKSNPPQKQ